MGLAGSFDADLHELHVESLELFRGRAIDEMDRLTEPQLAGSLNESNAIKSKNRGWIIGSPPVNSNAGAAFRPRQFSDAPT